MVQAAGSRPTGAEEGDSHKDLGLRVVWHCGYDIRTDTHLVVILPVDDHGRFRHVGGQIGGGETRGPRRCSTCHKRRGGWRPVCRRPRLTLVPGCWPLYARLWSVSTWKPPFLTKRLDPSYSPPSRLYIFVYALKTRPTRDGT